MLTLLHTQAWESIDKEQKKLHAVTKTFMRAFDVIVLPWIDLSDLLRSKGRRSMSASNKRKYGYLGHGKFRQSLIRDIGDISHPTNKIIWQTEECSSCLCGRCFRYNGYLGGSKVFKCPHHHCGVHCRRDGNAARNIWIWSLLRAIKMLHVLPPPRILAGMCVC